MRIKEIDIQDYARQLLEALHHPARGHVCAGIHWLPHSVMPLAKPLVSTV